MSIEYYGFVILTICTNDRILEENNYKLNILFNIKLDSFHKRRHSLLYLVIIKEKKGSTGRN